MGELMAGVIRRRTGPTMNASDLHRQWLELVDIEGPFLAIPPLKRVWPNGIPDFRATFPDRYEILADARKQFEVAWETLDRDPDGTGTLDSYRPSRDKWIETVLRDVIGWSESLHWASATGLPARSPNRAVTVNAQASLIGADGIGALVHVIDPTDSLRQTPNDLWAAAPIDRLEALLRENGVEIGIVTDGRWWGLVCASEGQMAASGIVDALTWVEEPRTRDAFLTLMARQHIVGGDPSERLTVLFAQSVVAAEEITEALGGQVRRAVELLIQSFSESAADARRRSRPDPLPPRTHDTYEAAVTVMMRTVFLLFAEERGLLPSGELFEQGYGVSRELTRLTAREKEESEEALDATSHTWHRLLATSQALFKGASFENLRMPAYGGSLFDPVRFPFLIATTDDGTLAVVVTDRVMLHVLRSIQVAIVQSDARQISFRDIDVEQIGYIYEGLLGYTCKTIDQTHLGIIGTTGAEPELPLTTLEQLSAANADPKRLAAAILERIASDQPSAKCPSAAAIARAIQTAPDPSVISALAQAVGDDLDLRDRVTPWLGLVRRDLRNHPFVILDGGLMVNETPSRKNAGAHYTPKALAEEVVLHALQPLCYSPGPHQTANEASWELKTSDELLDLKVADIACGSGAFLVAAARYLAERVVEAWTSEDPTNARRKDLGTRAIRQVVANCLYGADINDMAVEMCKLSLWLVSLDRDLPFSFVDDKIIVGNSLLGLTKLDQLRQLHIEPKRVPVGRGFDLFDLDIDAIIRKAVDLRERLATEIDEDDPARTSSAKQRQLHELRQATSSLRQIADGVIATGLPLGGKPGKALDEAYMDLRQAVTQAHGGHGDASADWLKSIVDRGLTPTAETDYERWQPIHWVLEVPDVFVKRGGFNAVVGNPPFLGDHKLSAALGAEVREWLAESIAGHAVGKADLVAYFVLRAIDLLAGHGSLGLIATNSIAQGDTRRVGLDQAIAHGLTITRAVRSAAWPSKRTSLQYAAFWGGVGPVGTEASIVSDGVVVRKISSLLEPAGRVEGVPVALRENAGLAFKGVEAYGDGFLINETMANSWIEQDPMNREVLFPFLNGDDLNNDPRQSASRWAINFGARSLSECELYHLPFSHILKFVQPERAKASHEVRKAPWWLYWRSRQAMLSAIAGLKEVLSIVIHSKTLMPVRVRADQVLSNALVIFALQSHADQASLSSSMHQLWAMTYGSSLKNDPRYTTSSVFETFPRAPTTPALERIGTALDASRREILLRRDLGLTTLYNLVNDAGVSDASDPDVARMREIHRELDETVMAAYGWFDVRLGHAFHTYRQVERWTVSPAARVEIMDRLLEENHRRADSEETSSKPKKTERKPPAVPNGTEKLFHE